MMVVDDTAYEQELVRLGMATSSNDHSDSNEQSLPVEKVVSIKHGRGQKLETPHELRKLISSMALSGEPHKEISKEFGVSQSSVSAYKEGATSTATINDKDEELVKHNSKVKLDISGTAAHRLQLALGTITQDKLEAIKIRDAAGIAKDMSVIMRNMAEGNTNPGMTQQVIVYQPRMKEEDDYEILEVASH